MAGEALVGGRASLAELVTLRAVERTLELRMGLDQRTWRQELGVRGTRPEQGGKPHQDEREQGATAD